MNLDSNKSSAILGMTSFKDEEEDDTKKKFSRPQSNKKKWNFIAFFHNKFKKCIFRFNSTNRVFQFIKQN